MGFQKATQSAFIPLNKLRGARFMYIILYVSSAGARVGTRARRAESRGAAAVAAAPGCVDRC